ncbi:MAG: 4Fe-4S binding protein [Acidimicrobiales bacterium]
MSSLGGFGVTWRKFAKGFFANEEIVTTEYSAGTRLRQARPEAAQIAPAARSPRPQPLRGRHGEVHRLRAVRRVCPAKCIYVRGADNDPADPTSPGERYGYVYEINFLRCIHCDLCVEACPTEAITESKLFEFSFTSREDAIYTKAELVVDAQTGKPQQLPWEDWREGDDEFTSGWVRATAAQGDADYVGRVGWSGELGYGVREAEKGQTAETPWQPAKPAADNGAHGHGH